MRAQNLLSEGLKGANGFERNEFGMEGVKTDSELLKLDFVKKMEFFSGFGLILGPKTVRFKRVQRGVIPCSGLFEQSGQMVKIEEGFSACNMDVGGRSG